MLTAEGSSADPSPCPIKNADDLRKILSLPKPVHLLQLEPSSATIVIELLYTELQKPGLEDDYRQCCIKCLKPLVKEFQTLPSSLFLRDVERDGTGVLTGGGFADVYKGISGGKAVCLKVLQVHIAESGRKREKLKADFCQEALLWTQLRHPNLLSLLRVNTNLFPEGLCLVSPWMDHGDIITFLRENPGHDRIRAVHEIVSGLEYLHSLSPTVVHGDIKGANILVDEKNHCLLADFGLADFAVETTIMAAASSSGAIKGSIRWMAPEVYSFAMGPEESTKEKASKEDKTPRDIYSFACTVLEIMTGKPPFHNLIDPVVMYRVSTNCIRPERPSEGWCPDHIWNLVKLSWDKDPLRRPTAKTLQCYLQRLIEAGNPFPRDPSFIGYLDLDDPPPTSDSEVSVNGMATAGPSQSPDHDCLYSNAPRDFNPTQTPAETLHGKISLPSPTNARDVTLFFQENKQQNDGTAIEVPATPSSLFVHDIERDGINPLAGGGFAMSQ
ncbi:hypothetical protein PM082_007324 [Marasmius tenuissimus]|nr:hypothetical protein PM082_007324 [Marasmius tenuissimus]